MDDGGIIEDATPEVLDLYESLPVRFAVESMSQVLNTDGIALMEFFDSEGSDALERLTKEDVPSMKAPESAVLLEKTEEMILIISAANISGEPSGWRFKNDEGASDFPADVFDSSFLDKIKNRQIYLSHGDMVRVNIQIQQSRPRRNLKTACSVIRVLEFIPCEDA
ncbi:hypothetical protein FACS1894167_12780 [Synergistales bacterium]|nr:hypothetical protein FACS1894167_12780 [Synergistales bacterium]